MKKNLSSDEMMTAILSYLGILVLIPLFVVKKRNDFIEFHLRQGLELFLIEVILWLLGSILFFLWPLTQILGLLNAVVFIISIIALIKAVMGEKWKIPLVWEYSQKLKLPK
ncbi:MAG: DUF4870 domain-containing protein [Candidatus Micrarchaeota archaeon]|nr:DUF4870 domain-containing protein [Candidatus Micrarchaeota archaeon]